MKGREGERMGNKAKNGREKAKRKEIKYSKAITLPFTSI